MSKEYRVTEEELRAAIRQILAEMLLGNQPAAPDNRRHYPTAAAWQKLGFDNQKQLYAAVESGILRLGHEVEDRRKPTGKKARYYFDLERCKQRLSLPPEKRKP